MIHVFQRFCFFVSLIINELLVLGGIAANNNGISIFTFFFFFVGSLIINELLVLGGTAANTNYIRIFTFFVLVDH